MLPCCPQGTAGSATAPLRRPDVRAIARALCVTLALLAIACAEPFERLVANRTDSLEAGLPTRRLPVADLHADSIMWGRDLLQDSTGTGHADLPRLEAGGVALQVFAVFTITPPADATCLTPAPDGGPRSGCADAAAPNMTALLQLLLLGRPAEALSPRETVERRALAFHDLVRRAAATDRPLLAIQGVEDLRELVRRRRAGERVIGALLALEGAHPLDPARVEVDVAWLHRLGYRMVGPVHRFDNAFAGSSEGVRAGGLTPAGERLVLALQRQGMVVDLAHLSSPALRRAAGLAQRPVVYSHGGIATNCRGSDPATAGLEECDRDRNLFAEDAAAIAEKGGVIGIGYWHEAVGTQSVASIVSAFRATEAALRAQGVRHPRHHLAIGSDFDGFVRTAVDATGHPVVLGALEQAFDAETARRIAWTNACIALTKALGGWETDAAFCEEMP